MTTMKKHYIFTHMFTLFPIDYPTNHTASLGSHLNSCPTYIEQLLGTAAGLEVSLGLKGCVWMQHGLPKDAERYGMV